MANEPTILPGSSQYRTIHNWLIRHYGKARICENPECKGRSNIYEWALKKGFEYQKNKENYFQLCASCHGKYDFSEKTMAAIKVNFSKGREARKRPIIKLHKNGKEAARYESLAQASKDVGCAHPSIIDAIKSNTYVKGFKWRYA